MKKDIVHKSTFFSVAPWLFCWVLFVSGIWWRSEDCSWCYRPLLCSLLTSVLAVAWPEVLEAPGAMGCDHTAWEQELTPLPKATSCIQRAKALVAGVWVSPRLWVWKPARAVGILWRSVAGQGSSACWSSQQRMCRNVLVLSVLFCALIFLQGNGLVYAVHSLDDSYHVFLWISGEPGPCHKRRDDKKMCFCCFSLLLCKIPHAFNHPFSWLF